jgi:hypothetical protein
MKINRLHAIIGFLLVLVPLLGFGRIIKDWTAIVLGAVILYLALRSIHDEIMKKYHKHRRHDSFVESRPRDAREKVERLSNKSEPRPATALSDQKDEDLGVTNESTGN